jgi:hypothetical protein
MWGGGGGEEAKRCIFCMIIAYIDSIVINNFTVDTNILHADGYSLHPKYYLDRIELSPMFAEWGHS